MEVEDYLEPEVAVTAVVAAAIFSPKARKLIRKGAVYGLSGLLVAGDVLTSVGKSIGQGASAAASQAATGTTDTKKPSNGKATTRAEQAEQEDQA